MGVNYYWYPRPPCPHCGRLDPASRVHIGKSSFGNPFMLHVGAPAPKDLPGWQRLWRDNGAIRTECGRLCPPRAMRQIILADGYVKVRGEFS